MSGFSFQSCITALMRKSSFCCSIEFNTFCHIFSASHDIRNYSALVWIEPGRLRVLLPCSWVSDSDRSCHRGLAWELLLCLRECPFSMGICSLPFQSKATSHQRWECIVRVRRLRISLRLNSYIQMNHTESLQFV